MNFVTLFLGLVLLNLFAYITIRLRPAIFKVQLFKPMLWNFKLSILPLIILILDIALSLGIAYARTVFKYDFLSAADDVISSVGLIIWLLLLPNAGYLITELNLTHRDMDKKEVPIWYDIVSVLSFALSGIINTLANIVLIQLVILVMLDPAKVTTENNVMLFLSSTAIIILIVIGMYLGRAIRFNSWDIIHIRSFFRKLKEHFSEKGAVKNFILYIIFNTIFFLIMYTSFGIPFYFLK